MYTYVAWQRFIMASCPVKKANRDLSHVTAASAAVLRQFWKKLRSQKNNASPTLLLLLLVVLLLLLAVMAMMLMMVLVMVLVIVLVMVVVVVVAQCTPKEREQVSRGD